MVPGCSFGFLGAKHPETTNQKPMQPVKHLLNLRACLNMKLLYTKIQVFLIIIDHISHNFFIFFPRGNLPFEGYIPRHPTPFERSQAIVATCALEQEDFLEMLGKLKGEVPGGADGHKIAAAVEVKG